MHRAVSAVIPARNRQTGNDSLGPFFQCRNRNHKIKKEKP